MAALSGIVHCFVPGNTACCKVPSNIAKRTKHCAKLIYVPIQATRILTRERKKREQKRPRYFSQTNLKKQLFDGFHTAGSRYKGRVNTGDGIENPADFSVAAFPYYSALPHGFIIFRDCMFNGIHEYVLNESVLFGPWCESKYVRQLMVLLVFLRKGMCACVCVIFDFFGLNHIVVPHILPMHRYLFVYLLREIGGMVSLALCCKQGLNPPNIWDCWTQARQSGGVFHRPVQQLRSFSLIPACWVLVGEIEFITYRFSRTSAAAQKCETKISCECLIQSYKD